MNKKDIVETFLRKDYLVSPDFFDFFDSFDEGEDFIDNLPHKNNILVITKDVLLILRDDNKTSELNWLEFEKSRAVFEKGKDVNIYHSFLDIINYNVNHKVRENLNKISEEITKPEAEIILEKEKKATNVTVIKSYVEEENKKREVDSFIKYFHARYNALKDILSKRVELQNAISINKINNKGNRDLVALIGIIQNKQLTKNGHIIVTLEDPTGIIKILFPKNKEFVFDMAQDLVLDEVIGVVGVNGGEIIFADGVYLPDIPITKEIKKCNDDLCAVFISDIHVGSNNFLEKEFLGFISWLNCNSEDNELAKKVKYIFVVGDVVDGIGVYPGQEQNLAIKDITKDRKSVV